MLPLEERRFSFRQFFNGCPRQDLLDLHRFLIGEDNEFSRFHVYAIRQLTDGSNPKALHIYCGIDLISFNSMTRTIDKN